MALREGGSAPQAVHASASIALVVYIKGFGRVLDISGRYKQTRQFGEPNRLQGRNAFYHKGTVPGFPKGVMEIKKLSD
jgi:hypothetical protein